MPRGTEITGPIQIEEVRPTAPSTGQLVFPVRGWVWWLLVACRYSLDNSGGAAGATPQIQSEGGAAITIASISATAVGAGLTQAVSASLFSQLATVATIQTIPLHFCPIIGDGILRVGFNGGDAATAVSGIALIIVGQVRRREKSRG